MEKVALVDLFMKPISGEWGKDPDKYTGNAIGILRTTNFSNDIRVKHDSEIAKRIVDEKKIEKKKLVYGDIVIEKSGGSPTQPVGRVLYYDLNSGTNLCNNFTSILRTKKGNDSKYLAYLLLWLYKKGDVMKYQNKTTGIINLKLDRYLKSTVVKIPPLQTQKKIVEVLDKAQELIDLRKKQIELLDELIQSIFYDTFGDPVTNPKGWEVKKIGDVFEVKTGATPSRKNKNYWDRQEIPWVKTNEVINGVITATEEHISLLATKEANVTILPVDTILIAMYGQGKTRGRIAKLAIEATTNQACAALLPNNKMNTDYVFNYLKFSYDKLRDLGRGGNQPNLNLTLVREFQLLEPPIQLQNQFVQKVQKIEQQKQLMEEALTEMENNFNSLMQRAFKGELFN